MTEAGWDNAAVRRGTQGMLAYRSKLIAGGDSTIGWKLAFGAPAWLEKFGLSGPLVGFLPGSTRHESGTEISCEEWLNPVAEPEIAVHLGRDVEDPARARESISGMGAAIELADVHPPPEDIEEALAGNIFHRALILGEPQAGLTIAGLRARVQKNGTELADTTHLEAITGEVTSILGHAAALLAAAGEMLRAGEVVIMGSVIPPISVQPGDEISYELAPLDPISVKV